MDRQPGTVHGPGKVKRFPGRRFAEPSFFQTRQRLTRQFRRFRFRFHVRPGLLRKTGPVQPEQDFRVFQKTALHGQDIGMGKEIVSAPHVVPHTVTRPDDVGVVPVTEHLIETKRLSKLVRGAVGRVGALEVFAVPEDFRRDVA